MGPIRRALASSLVVVALVALATLETVAAGTAASPARAAVLGERGAAFAPPASLSPRTRPALVEPARPDPRARFSLVEIDRAMVITARPGGGRVVGTMPAGSRFYGAPTVAWVHRVSDDGGFGLVDVPYVATRASGWIPLQGLVRSWTRVAVLADLSDHRITVLRGGEVLFRTPATTGAPSSPTPPGRYFVTDRVPFPGGGSLGTFAFGISGIQPRLPAGWSGGDQLAIHGTNAPWSIGRSASAGCLRVSERVLDRLRPLLQLGTPVIVRR